MHKHLARIYLLTLDVMMLLLLLAAPGAAEEKIKKRDVSPLPEFKNSQVVLLHATGPSTSKSRANRGQ